MTARSFALVDCNNFYVSCERVFDPALGRRPVLVLSNNDGCIIARSDEVKALGIVMGTPLFEARPLIEEHGIEVYSSNYVLYGDMSGRVMSLLGGFTPNLEIYSIDEAFLDFSGFGSLDLTRHGLEIRDRVRRCTGIPVSIGIAPTKTLAKLANRIAKKSPEAGGVCELNPLEDRHGALSGTAVRDVWGIGRNYARMLNRNGIHSALDLHDAPGPWVRRRMGVAGARTWLELRGIPCIETQTQTEDRKSAVVSRSFKRPLERLEELREAVAAFAERAAEKIRRQNLAAASVIVFIHTNRFASEDGRYKNATTVNLPMADNHTGRISKAALGGLEHIFRPGRRYKKAGVMLVGLEPEKTVQPDLFTSARDGRGEKLMKAFDGINRKFGAGKIRYAATGIGQTWRTAPMRRSPRYTTNWDELPGVW